MNWALTKDEDELMWEYEEGDGCIRLKIGEKEHNPPHWKKAARHTNIPSWT